jgi:hypothetical protein
MVGKLRTPINQPTFLIVHLFLCHQVIPHRLPYLYQPTIATPASHSRHFSTSSCVVTCICNTRISCNCVSALQVCFGCPLDRLSFVSLPDIYQSQILSMGPKHPIDDEQCTQPPLTSTYQTSHQITNTTPASSPGSKRQNMGKLRRAAVVVPEIHVVPGPLVNSYGNLAEGLLGMSTPKKLNSHRTYPNTPSQ